LADSSPISRLGEHEFKPSNLVGSIPIVVSTSTPSAEPTWNQGHDRQREKWHLIIVQSSKPDSSRAFCITRQALLFTPTTLFPLFLPATPPTPVACEVALRLPPVVENAGLEVLAFLVIIGVSLRELLLDQHANPVHRAVWPSGSAARATQLSSVTHGLSRCEFPADVHRMEIHSQRPIYRQDEKLGDFSVHYKLPMECEKSKYTKRIYAAFGRNSCSATLFGRRRALHYFPSSIYGDSAR